MTSSESEGQPQPKKRARTANSAEDGSHKKARGRPRVDTQDATAADRRRTQIRLAQRAYRQRKESTISSLQKENNQLHSIIEGMNQAFLRFNDSVVKSGLLSLNSELAQELKGVTENFVRLAQSVSVEDRSAGDESGGDVEADHTTEWYQTATSTKPSVMSLPIQPIQPSEVVHGYTDIGMGYSAVLTSPGTSEPTQPSLYQPSSYFPDPRQMATEMWKESNTTRSRAGGLSVNAMLDNSEASDDSSDANQPVLPFGLVDNSRGESAAHLSQLQVSRNTLPSPNLTPPPTRLSTPPSISQILEANSLRDRILPTPYTYSFQETSFSRQLTRAAFEKGFRLLSTNNPPAATLKQIFGLSPFRSINELRERFQRLLARGPHEPLELCDAPFLHLGGAGTHYPRKDAHGNHLPIKNAWTVKGAGPFEKPIVQNTEDPSQVHNLLVDLTQFEGVWFDAHDVQGYLEQEKGLVINPHETFAECLIEVDDDISIGPQRPSLAKSSSKSGSPGERSIGLSTMRANSPSSNTLFGQPTTTAQQTETAFGLDMIGSDFSDFSKFGGLETVMYEQPLGLDLSGGFESTMHGGLTEFGNMANLGMDLMGPVGEPLPVVRQKPKRPVLVDVSKLIDEVVQRGICLGRAPGFRKSDVEIAFKAALIQVY